MTDDILYQIYKLFTLKEYKDIFPHIRFDYVKRMWARNQIFVINVNNEVVGALIYHVYMVSNPKNLGMRGDVQLSQIVVLPNYTGSGIAQTLWTQLVELACRINSHQIVLSVRKSNIRAISFYKKMGMQIVGETTWSSGQIPGYIMSFQFDKHVDDIQTAIFDGMPI